MPADGCLDAAPAAVGGERRSGTEEVEAPPKGAPVVSVRDWYFQDPKTQQPTGPWSAAQLRVRWQRHRIDGLTLVWRTGLDTWRPLGDVAELKAELRETAREEGDDAGSGRGTKRKRRKPLEAVPLTHTYTSNQGVLLVFDTVDRDWKISEIYEDLVQEENEPEPEAPPAAEAAAPAAVAGPEVEEKEDKMSPEAEEALRELLADADKGSASLGSGGQGTTLLGLSGAAKVAAKAKGQADVASDARAASAIASGTPLTEEQEAKAKKRREYRERKKLKRQAGLFIKAQENRNVYVSGLPPDITLQELEPVFKRGGVLKVDVDTGGSKIRIYTDAEGRCKGDALVSYANPESVELAIKFLHELELRPDCRICVQEADFDEKEEAAPKLSKEELKTLASKRNMDTERKKYRAAKNLEKEAVSWSGEMDDGTGRKIVLLKHMFSLEEAEQEGADFYPELAEEVQAECEKVGQVVKVTPIEGHKQGIVSVKFKSSAEAEECIRVMDGRFFAGRTIEAFFYDGKTDLRAIGTAKKHAPAKPQGAGAVAAVADEAASDAENLSGMAKGEEAQKTPVPEQSATEAAPKFEKTWEEWLEDDSNSDSDSDLQIRTEE